MYTFIKTLVASLLIIFLVDHLIHYFKNMYSNKKTKDVVGFHMQKYQTIMEELQENNEKKKQEFMEKMNQNENYNNEKKDLDENDLRHMNEDLTSFIKRQINE